MKEVDTQIKAGDKNETWIAGQKAITSVNLYTFWARDARRTASIRGQHPVETVISDLHQRGGTERHKRTETESEREQRKKLNKVNKAFEGCSTSHLFLQNCTLTHTLQQTQTFQHAMRHDSGQRKIV